ncbi:hypothetical protein E2C01_057316 [Portunus trituberculatus]|uniref:Uncharacterized protein n=1 Tax=Portunus trituberculatus TaxID=210409 RepID=A0A5B7GWG7_PORTR|nr:hypothetical protein [Portunus trituberculatus]
MGNSQRNKLKQNTRGEGKLPLEGQRHKEGEQKRNKYHCRRVRVLKVTYTNEKWYFNNKNKVE